MYLLSKSVHLLGFLITLLLANAICKAEDWTQFRGPRGNAVSDATNTAVEVSANNTAWQVAIPGTGWSSPVVQDGRIWLTTAETTEATKDQIKAKTAGVQFAQIKTVAGSVRLRAICIDAATGQIIHNRLLREIDDPDLINPLNSYASPTPAISGDRVVCHFGSYGTWCLQQTTGQPLWERALVVDHSVGPGSSPVIAGNVVLLVCDGIDKQFVAGLDLKTGQELWKTARPAIRATNGEFKKAYSTPLMVRVDGQLQAVIPGAQWVCAYDPASGSEIWRADCGDGFSTTPMPVFESGVLVCSTGFMAADLVAIAPSGRGDISKSIVWRARKGGSTMPTAVARGGKVYSISDDGILTILNAKSGELIDRERIGGKFASSPLLVANKLYLGNQSGEFLVYQIDPDGGKPTQIAQSQLDGAIMASPAVIGSDLIVRTSKSLLRVTPD